MASTTPPSTVAGPGDPVTVELARLAGRLRARGLTSAEAHAATRAVLDWFGATIAGSVMPPARILEAAVAEEATGGAARLVPSGRHLPTRTAALINATASHTVEMDDIYREGIYHPGSPTVAAALAVGQRLGRSRPHVLRAVAIRYEIGGRIAETIHPAPYEFWH